MAVLRATARSHHLPRTRLSIYLAAAPAIVGSVWLMRRADVGGMAIAMQVALFAAAAIILALIPPGREQPKGDARRCAIAAVLAASLLLPPALYADGSPQRWIALGSVRLYMAPVILPALLLLVGRLSRATASTALWAVGGTVAAAGALLLQPDAAQLTALACAMVPVLGTARVSHVARGLVALALVAGAMAAWQRPDPLSPVPHVEGVFQLAATESPLALTASVLAAIAPAAALLWRWRESRSAGVLAVAIYYVVVLAQAPLLVTPDPFLGFGAGPILGYFLVALLAPACASSS